MAGAVPKNDSFLGCGREYSGEYVSTITSTYGRNQRPAVFWHALASVIRVVVLWMYSLSFVQTTFVFVSPPPMGAHMGLG